MSSPIGSENESCKDADHQKRDADHQKNTPKPPLRELSEGLHDIFAHRAGVGGRLEHNDYQQ
jgi:hypothetical protein